MSVLVWKKSGVLTLVQGFRKYLTQSKDHEELLAFLLGGLIKDKAKFYQLQRHEQPELVTVRLSELEERVCVQCSPVEMLMCLYYS